MVLVKPYPVFQSRSILLYDIYNSSLLFDKIGDIIPIKIMVLIVLNRGR